MLVCSVRNCHLPLTREERRLFCPRGHSFDVARSGYVNLLQPQERRSKQPGDTIAAVNGRRRLHERGVTEPLLHAIRQMIAATSKDVVLDAGCGEGFYLGTLATQTGFQAHGVDISIPAIDAASRRYRECEWVVANADRFLPYTDASFSLILSITARMNAEEFRRVLQPSGRLLIAIPAPEDLAEIRGKGHDRTARTIQEFSPWFQVTAQHRTTTVANLEASAVEDVIHSIYRPHQPEPLTAMELTFSLDLLLFRLA